MCDKLDTLTSSLLCCLPEKNTLVCKIAQNDVFGRKCSMGTVKFTQASPQTQVRWQACGRRENLKEGPRELRFGLQQSATTTDVNLKAAYVLFKKAARHGQMTTPRAWEPRWRFTPFSRSLRS